MMMCTHESGGHRCHSGTCLPGPVDEMGRCPSVPSYALEVDGRAMHRTVVTARVVQRGQPALPLNGELIRIDVDARMLREGYPAAVALRCWSAQMQGGRSERLRSV